jgi:hypothetical protein
MAAAGIERRDFLRMGALAGAGAAALGTSGCAGITEALAPPPLPLSNRDMELFLSRLDHSMKAVSTTNALSSLLPKKALDKIKTDDPEFQKNDQLFRKTLRSLLLVGSFKDLPEEGRVHPGMQDRMWRALPEMNDAMLGMTDMLEALTPTERADIGRMLRKDPDLGMRIIGALDNEAAVAGVTLARRMHMRTVAADTSFRMRQSTPLFIEEYTGKVRKIADRQGSSEAFQRRLAAQMGDAAFWGYQARTQELASRWQIARADAGDEESANENINGPYAPGVGGKKEPRGGTALMVGGILLGVGALIAGIGGLIVASSGDIGGAILITVGAAVGLGGLITLIVGAIMRLAS